jgi:hypothetical protein
MRLKKDKKKNIHNKFFRDLRFGLKDVVAYKKNKLTLRSEEIEILASQILEIVDKGIYRP